MLPQGLGDKVGLSRGAKPPRVVIASIGISCAWLECATAATCHGFRMCSNEKVEALVRRIISPSKKCMKREVQLSPVSHGILKKLAEEEGVGKN